MPPTINLNYLGNLRTAATHNQSQSKLNTDAPIDNNGKGESFSPTDMVAASLGSCMLTMMGIIAEKNEFPFVEATGTVSKQMFSNPRRIGKLEVEILIKDEKYSAVQRRLLENGALNCPVAKSLHSEIEQVVRFEYY